MNRDPSEWRVQISLITWASSFNFNDETPLSVLELKSQRVHNKQKLKENYSNQAMSRPPRLCP